MKGKFYVLTLLSALLFLHGCFAYTLGETMGNVVAFPVEMTFEITGGFLDGFFGVEPKKETKPAKTETPTKREETQPIPEEKKKPHRDPYGNLKWD